MLPTDFLPNWTVQLHLHWSSIRSQRATEMKVFELFWHQCRQTQLRVLILLGLSNIKLVFIGFLQLRTILLNGLSEFS